jgi:hypothetical protein
MVVVVDVVGYQDISITYYAIGFVDVVSKGR